MKIPRRDFLTTAAAALGAAAAGFPRITRAATTSVPRNLVVVLNAGGWDVTYALDPKPGLTTVDVGPGTVKSFGNIPIFSDAGRPNVDAFFQAYSGISAVVNGIAVRGIAHPACMKRTLTGTPDESKPDVAMITSWELGRDLPVPYLVLGTTAYTGPLAAAAGRVGATNQIVTLLDPATDAYPAPPGSTFTQPCFVPDANDEASIRQFVLAGSARERALRGSAGYNGARIADFETALTRGDLFKTYRPQMGNRGRTVSMAAQVQIAVNAIHNGVSWAVMVDSGQAWDTHVNDSTQAGDWDASFTGIKTLADTLAATPGKQSGNTMLDETVVVCLSEMSRTPKLNAAAGKDHWPVTSALVFGAGVRGNAVYGGTDDGLQAQTVDYATGAVSSSGVEVWTDNLMAGLLTLVGVDPSGYLPTSEPFLGFVA